MPAPNVLERSSELDRLGVAVKAAARGDGGVVLIQGSAGIGKTELLRATRTMAGDEGLVTLTATASELDRDFPFGLVHQLFDAVLTASDDERRERLRPTAEAA
jgi:predicted ATPase